MHVLSRYILCALSILSSRSVFLYSMSMIARCVYYFQDVYILSSRSLFLYLMTTMARCRILQQLLLFLLAFTIFTISKLLPFLLLLAIAFTMQRKLRHQATSLWTTDNIKLYCFLLSESLDLFTFFGQIYTICIFKKWFWDPGKTSQTFLKLCRQLLVLLLIF